MTRWFVAHSELHRGGIMTRDGVGGRITTWLRRGLRMVPGPAAVRTDQRLGHLVVDTADGAFGPAAPRPGGSGRIRIASVGDLAPQSAVADLLLCAVAWAERHPGCALEISWIGDGDLRGVLAAQPLPVNLTQRFCDKLTDELGGFDLLLIPDRGPTPARPLDIAMAAGTPIIGCVQNDDVRRRLSTGAAGWLFDANRPASLMAALNRALAAAPRPAEPGPGHDGDGGRMVPLASQATAAAA
jgi:hypothetical protein